MTIVDLFWVYLRRWPIVLIGLAATVAALVPIDNTPGVYSAQTDAIFLAPPSARFPNSLASTSDNLTALAGVIERQVNGGRATVATASSDVTIVDLGIENGSLIDLPNAGGQWVYYFSRPVLEVQVVGGSASAVRSAMTAQLNRIRDALNERQRAAGVAEINYITVSLLPQEITILYSGGHRRVAALVAAGLGVAITLSLAVIVDRWVRERKSRRNGARSLLADTSLESASYPGGQTPGMNSDSSAAGQKLGKVS